MTAIASDESPERIGVFRALQLGDLLCAVPALRALRAHWPRAKITLIGLPWARFFASRFRSYVDDFIEFPGYPALPETSFSSEHWIPFLKEVQARNLDLLIQMHGSGMITNPLCSSFGARRLAGYFVPGQYCPDPELFLPYPEREPEVRRHLRLARKLGAAIQGDELEFPLEMEDGQALEKELPPGVELCPGKYVCIHPGARAEHRRWEVRKFAEVADELASRGLEIMITGTGGERALCEEMASAMRYPAINLAGRTGLGALGWALKHARLVLCNDTGISHMACGVGVPSVVIFTIPENAGWPPLNRQRHRVVSAVEGVPVSQVMIEIEDLLSKESRFGSLPFIQPMAGP